MISFVIYGNPKSKARPRVFSRNGRHMVFSPSARDEQDFLTQALPYKPERPLQSSLSIEIKFYHAIPKSFSKKKAQQAIGGEIRPAKKPDCSNLAKLVEDALNGVFYRDDSQIVSIAIDKFYGEVPRTEVKIEEV